MIEVWKDIPEFAGIYQASNLGRIRSANGHVFALHPLGNVRYLGVRLRKGGDRFTRTVHRLVLEAFVGPRPEGMAACHNNGNCTDNRIANLRWDTVSENHRDKVRHGTHNNAKKTRCKRGHLLSGANLKASALKGGRRECRSCGNANASNFKYGKDFTAVADTKYLQYILQPLGL